MVLVAIPRFLGMGNQLGPFSEASDRPEGQELGGRAVGGQEGLQAVLEIFIKPGAPKLIHNLYTQEAAVLKYH